MQNTKELKEEELTEVSGGDFMDEYGLSGSRLNEGDVFLIKNYKSEFSKPGLVVAKTQKASSNSTNIGCVKFDYILDLKRVTHVDHMITYISYGELMSDYEKRTDIVVNVPRFD